MILSIIKFFTTLIDTLFKALTAFVEWVRDNPKLAASLAFLLACVVFTYFWTKADTTKKVTAQYTAVIAVYKENEEALQKKIKETEASSKAAADNARQGIDKAQTDMLTLAGEYELKLAEEKKARQAKGEIIYVDVPGQKEKGGVVMNGGEVVCNRLPDSFLEVWNGMIDLANKREAK
jgi:hypothetical protein